MGSWEQPFWWLLALVVLPLGFLAYRQLNQKKALRPVGIGWEPWVSRWVGTWPKLGFLLWILWVVLVLILLGLPFQEDVIWDPPQNTRDILITLDISDSMLIEDIEPINRLEAAKATIIQFVKRRSLDRLGLIVFAGEAFMLVPFTRDHEFFIQQVQALKTAKDANIRDGTAIGVALALSAFKLKNSKAPEKVMLFLTDGDNNTGTIDPEAGLQIVKQLGVRVYSIALGQRGPTKLPIYQKDPWGRTFKTYQPFFSDVNEPFLRRLAQETQGRFWSAYDHKTLSEIFSEVDRLETYKEKARRRRQRFYPVDTFLKWQWWVLGLWLLGFSLYHWGVGLGLGTTQERIKS